LIGVRHDKAMKKVTKLAEEPSFGEVAKMDTFNLNGVKVETYSLNKKQAIAVGAKLNNKLLMKVIDRLEELEKAKSQPKELTRTELALMVLVKMSFVKECLGLNLKLCWRWLNGRETPL
jgi:phage regulator Rha-like protein